MIVIKSALELDHFLNALKIKSKKIGFVATMGALHSGHISLIERSNRENDTTVCSIFVNPRQFNDPKDLEKYPRPIEKDILLLTKAGCDIVFIPTYDDIYPPGYLEPKINLNGLDTILEGAMRPGHFHGVALVVKRLFDCVKPDTAYFGQKDYQQTLVIKQIVEEFKLSIKIVVTEILREENGLAMSSRNIRLSEEQRKSAGFIYSALLQLKKNVKYLDLKEALEQARETLLKEDNTKIEYIAVVDPSTLLPIEKMDENKTAIALVVVNYFGVRLLDNLYL
jgi:pantoate--beta-alanine ligase